jgi:hypothetical protein
MGVLRHPEEQFLPPKSNSSILKKKLSNNCFSQLNAPSLLFQTNERFIGKSFEIKFKFTTKNEENFLYFIEEIKEICFSNKVQIKLLSIEEKAISNGSREKFSF